MPFLVQSTVDIYEKTGTPLDGAMPKEIQFLTGLQQFVLPNFKLKGDVLPLLSDMPQLERLDLVGNNFTGTIPDTFSSDHPNLRTMNLPKNRFAGSIPSSLGTLSYLQTLNLAGNVFQGTIPPSLGSINSLRKCLGQTNGEFAYISFSNEKTFVVSYLYIRNAGFTTE